MSFLLFGANLLESATVTATSAATGYPVTRLYDRARSLPWQATSNAQQDIDIDLGSAATTHNYIGLAGLTVTTAITVYHGAAFPPTTLATTISSPPDPHMAGLGAALTDRYVRVRIASGGVTPALGELFIGQMREVTLPPFLRSAGRGTMGNVRRDTSPAGYTWTVKRGVKRARFAYAWTGLTLAELGEIEAVYDQIDQGAKAFFLFDETNTTFWVHCVTPTLAPVPVGAGLYELPEFACEEALWKTLTANTTLAVSRAYIAPIYLLQIDFTSPTAKTLYLSDRYLASVGTHEWLPLVADWGSLESAVNSLDVNGSPGTATLSLINTVPIEGRSRISDLIRTPLNADQSWEWADAKVTVRQTFAGLTDAADLVQLGVFFLEDPTEIGQELLALRMSDQALVIENALRVTKVNRAEFPLCNKADLGRSIPRPFGVLKDVVCVPVVESVSDRLNGAITASATSLTLFDGTDFPVSGPTVALQIDGEHLYNWTRSGNTFTGLTRGINGTTAAPHVHGTQVYLVRNGATAYRFAAGEHAGTYKIRSVSNVTIDGQPIAAPVTASITLEDTAIVPGKAFAMIDLNVYAKFWQSAAVSAERDVSVSGLGSTLNGNTGSPTSPMTRTIAPGSVGGTTSTQRAMSGTVSRAGNLTGTIYWQVWRGQSGVGDDVIVASGTFASMTASPVHFSDTKIYPSTLNEVVTFVFTGGEWNDGLFALDWTAYHVKDSATTLTGGGPTSIGTVRCDIEGIQDDSTGTFTGTPALLLENPADVTRFILVQLYGVSTSLLGSSWASTRAALAGAGYRWAFPLEFDTFSNLRRQFGEQGRSVLYIEAGIWEYQFLEDAPVAAQTLDYARDVWDGEPALIRRSNRTDVINSLNVNAAYSDFDANYHYRKTFEDLTIIPQIRTQELTLAWVQDTATADALGAYWLGVWRRQRFEVSLTAWWNALALTKADYLRIDHHPVLDAHGGAGVVFRILRRDDRVSDNRVRLEGVEAALLPAPRLPETEEDVIFNCRLTYVSPTSIRLDPYQGNQIRVKIGSTWSVGTVPDAGVTKDTTGLAASTFYYVYLYDVSGTLALEISATVSARDSATGIQIKTGDATRTLVGMVRTNASTQFTSFLVRSYFNRATRSQTTTFTADRTTTSGANVEFNTEIRNTLLTWGDEAVSVTADGSVVNSGVNNILTSIGVDASLANVAGLISVATGITDQPLALAGALTLSEGFHTLTLIGGVTGGTGTWRSYCGLTVQVRG